MTLNFSLIKNNIMTLKFAARQITVPEIAGHRTCYLILLILIYVYLN